MVYLVWGCKTLSKNNWGKKEFAYLATHSPSLREAKAGFKAGAEAETTEEHCLLAGFPGLCLAIILVQQRLFAQG